MGFFKIINILTLCFVPSQVSGGFDSLVNASPSILRLSDVNKFKIRRRQQLNAVCWLLAAKCINIFCCVLCPETIKIMSVRREGFKAELGAFGLWSSGEHPDVHSIHT